MDIGVWVDLGTLIAVVLLGLRFAAKTGAILNQVDRNRENIAALTVATSNLKEGLALLALSVGRHEAACEEVREGFRRDLSRIEGKLKEVCQ